MSVIQSTYSAPRADLGAALWEYAPAGTRYIAEDVLAVVDVQRKSATFPKIVRESLLKRADARQAAQGAYNRIDLETEDATYNCVRYGLEAGISDEQRQFYASDFDAEMAVAEQLYAKLRTEQEIRVAAAVFNTSTWTGSALYTDVSSAPWDAAASDAIGHIRAAKEKVRQNSGLDANALIIGAATFNNLLANTALLARFPGVTALTEQMLRDSLAGVVGIQYLLVGNCVYDAANQGIATTAVTDVWSDDYAMIARVAQPGAPITEPCVGRTFRWASYAPNTVTVEQYREEQTELDVIRVKQHVDEVILVPECGHLLKVDA